MEAMGADVFAKPPMLERAHCSLAPKPRADRPPRPFVVCFHSYKEKEKALRWARQHKLSYNGSFLRLYPVLSAALSRKRAVYKEIKRCLFERNVRFQLLYPARLRVNFNKEILTFDSPEDAQKFYKERICPVNSLLAGLPLRAIRPLQLVQNAAARLIFNLPKFTHVTPLLRSLHWLPVVARIRFKTLMLAYKAKNGPAPPYLMVMVKSRAVPRALRASSTARLEPPSLRTHGRQASRLFSVLAPRWWNELPLGVRTAESLAVFKRRLKTHLFVKHLSTSTDPLFGQCLSS
ncbi:hypothetical protein NFI96_023463, partial [Prochilodus magdalenae]